MSQTAIAVVMLAVMFWLPGGDTAVPENQSLRAEVLVQPVHYAGCPLGLWFLCVTEPPELPMPDAEGALPT